MLGRPSPIRARPAHARPKQRRGNRRGDGKAVRILKGDRASPEGARFRIAAFLERARGGLLGSRGRTSPKTFRIGGPEPNAAETGESTPTMRRKFRER